MIDEKILEIHSVAKRLQVHPSTVRRMFHQGILTGYLTGPSMTRIRIFESSLDEHMQRIINVQNEQ